MIRNVIIHSDDIDPFTQLLLIVASRKRNIDLHIKPALEKNNIVISDRFGLSTIVYQGVVQGIPLKTIRQLFTISDIHLKPNVEIILDVDPEVGLNRVMTNDREVSAIDKKGLEFHSKINEAYLHNNYVAKDGCRITIDANRNLDDVFTDVVNAVTNIMVIDGRFKNVGKDSE